jgi:hypothetical protein
MNGQRAHTLGTTTLAAVLVLLIPARFAEAQGASSATLRGTVLDASGSVLPGAKLILTSVRTLAVRTATSDSVGSYPGRP